MTVADPGVVHWVRLNPPSYTRGGHANKHHSHSCDRARSTRILRKWWSCYAFFRILLQSQRSKLENQHSQQSKSRKSVQSTVKQRKRAVKVLTRGRSYDCGVYWRDLPLVSMWDYLAVVECSGCLITTGY